MLSNCGVGEDSCCPLDIKGIQSLERLMLKLKLQYFGHLMWRNDSFEKTLMLRKIEGRRRRVDRGWDSWMASPTQWTWVWASSGSWWWTGRPDVLQSMGSQRFRHNWVIELNWTDSHWTDCLFYILPYCLCKQIENTNVLKSSIEIIVNFYKSDQLLRHCCKAVVSERQAIIK